MNYISEYQFRENISLEIHLSAEAQLNPDASTRDTTLEKIQWLS